MQQTNKTNPILQRNNTIGVKKTLHTNQLEILFRGEKKQKTLKANKGTGSHWAKTKRGRKLTELSREERKELPLEILGNYETELKYLVPGTWYSTTNSTQVPGTWYSTTNSSTWYSNTNSTQQSTWTKEGRGGRLLMTAMQIHYCLILPLGDKICRCL